MKLFVTILISIVACLSIHAQIQTDSLIQAAAIVDGLFFDKSMPTKSLIPGSATMAIFKDPDGGKVLGVYLPQGYILDESTTAKAIPAERVKFAEKLLKDYNGRKPQTVVTYQGIGVNEGEPMIEFEYYDIDGNLWNNRNLKDKIFVINIWQSECGPCRREMPILSKWKERFANVTFLSASRHSRDEILPVVSKHEFTWTHLQEASDLVALVGQEGFPLTIVVDKEGIVRFAKVGASEENQRQVVAILDKISR